MINDASGDEPAIARMLIVSTAHIRPEDNERLLRAPEEPLEGLCVDVADGGYYISIITLAWPHYSAELTRVLGYAMHLDCTHLRLDRDGPIYSQLPTFDW